jgi:hypothetical protein
MPDTMFGYDVVYVDPEISSPGTGETPETALASLPAVASILANKVYLIAPRDTAMTLTVGANTQPNVYLIGMPKEGDWLYQQVPQNAIDAWGDIANELAPVIPSTATGAISFKNDAGELGMHRIKFTLMNFNDNTAPGTAPFLDIGSATADPAQNYGKSGFVTNCEFRSLNGEIDNASVTVVNNAAFNMWFRASGFANLRFTQNKIVYPGRLAGWNLGANISYTGPFTFQACFRVVIRDIECWTGTAYTYNRPSGDGAGNDRQLFHIVNVGDVELSNISHNWVAQQQNAVAFVKGLVFLTGVNHTQRVSRIKSRFVRMFNTSIPPSVLCLSTPVVEITGVTGGTIGVAQRDERLGMFIEDIDVESGPCWTGVPSSPATAFSPTATTYNGMPLVKINGPIAAGTSYVGDYMTHNFDGYIRNIRAVVPDTGGIGQPNIPYAVDISFPLSHTRAGAIRGIEARNRKCGSLWIEGNVYTAAGKTPGDVSCPPIKIEDLEGILWARKVGYLEVDYLGVDRYQQWLGTEGSTIYLHEVEVDKMSWLETAVPFARWFSSRVVIDKINVPIKVPVSGMTCYGRNGLIVNSENDFEGKSKFTNGTYHGENYNVYRQGGAVSSIRLYGRNNIRVPLQVGFDMFKNIEVTATEPGPYNMVLHMIHTGYADAQQALLPRRFVVRMKAWQQEQFGDGSGTALKFREFNSQTNGWWTRHNSSEEVWKNIEIYFPYTCTIPVTLYEPDAEAPGALTVKVRVEFDFYDANGYCYLDPQVDLVSLADE